LGLGFSKNKEVRNFLKGQEFLHKFGWKVINLVAQSIDRLYCVSQLYPSTNKQEKSSKMIYPFKIIQLLDRKMINSDTVLKMILFDNLSNNLSFIGSVGIVRILCLYTNIVLIKQYIDPELTRA